MAGFEPGSSGIGSDHSSNCATTTALLNLYCDVFRRRRSSARCCKRFCSKMNKFQISIIQRLCSRPEVISLCFSCFLFLSNSQYTSVYFYLYFFLSFFSLLSINSLNFLPIFISFSLAFILFLIQSLCIFLCFTLQS